MVQGALRSREYESVLSNQLKTEGDDLSQIVCVAVVVNRFTIRRRTVELKRLQKS